MNLLVNNRKRNFTNPSVCMVVSKDYLEDPRVLREALTLSKADLRVYIWTWHRSLTGDRETLWGGHYINQIRIPLLFRGEIGVAIAFPLFWIAAVVRIMRLKPQVVHCHDFDTLLVGFVIRILTRAKVVFDAHEIYSEMVSETVPRPIAHIIRTAELLAARLSDLLLVPSEDRIAYYRGVARILVAPNSPSISGSKPPIGKPADEIFYAGGLDTNKGILEIVEAASKQNRVHLVMAGFGPLEEFVRERSKATPHLTFLGAIRQEEVFERLWRSAATVVMYRPSNLNNKLAASNKLFEAMMVGVPVITNAECSCAQVVKREECGIVVPYHDVFALAKAMGKLTEDKELRGILGKNGYAAFNNRYAWEHYEPRFVREYRELALN